MVARLNHPGVIRVHGLGRFPSGGYFLVMDWIDGVDLQTRIDQRQLVATEAMRIVMAVAEAITHSHQAGVVHCDLKPANVLLGREGEVIVTDFGFAQIITGKHKATAIGGTAGYVAPELLKAGTTPAPAADIFSLGKLLDRLLPVRNQPINSAIHDCTNPVPSNRLDAQSLVSRLETISRSGANEDACPAS